MPGAKNPDQSAVVVVPTYNEGQNIGSLIEMLSALPLRDLRVIIVDDSSPDGTADRAEAAARALPNRPASFVTVIRRQVKDGLGRAYVAGMSEAITMNADLIIQMDADLSHQPSYIPQMVDKLAETDADVVIGSRYVAGGSLADEWKLHRRVLSGWANFYVNAILSMNIRDATAGFKVWRSSMVSKIGLEQIYSNGYAFQVEMNYRCQRLGGKLVEFPIHFEERDAGVSKMTLGVKIESALMPFRLRHRIRRD